ncbi:TlpA family protein disulfide reductase [Bremerella cremea]
MIARRGKTMLYVLLAIMAGLMVMLVITMLGPGAAQMAESHPWVGQPLPATTLEPMLNVEQPLETADLAGKVTLINFWGPWCPPCLLEFPDLLQIREEFRDQPDFAFVSVAADGGWMPGQPTSFNEDLETLVPQSQLVLAKFNTTLPVYVDQHADLRIGLSQVKQYQGYPTTLLVDQQGKIQAVWIGYGGDLSDISKKIRELLEAG